MSAPDDFSLETFLPYLLNQAAEASGRQFQKHYRDRYGMLRTEWRVLFHLGQYGTMSARDICDRASLHKTKVSRAVAALEAKRFLRRARRDDDRRHESLTLTKAGEAAFTDLIGAARRFDAKLAQRFSGEEIVVLRRCLVEIAR